MAIFKPRDEEIGQDCNPHGNVGSDRTYAFAPGTGSRREVLAFRLDHGGFAGVPPTVEVATHIHNTSTSSSQHQQNQRRKESETSSSAAAAAHLNPFLRCVVRDRGSTGSPVSPTSPPDRYPRDGPITATAATTRAAHQNVSSSSTTITVPFSASRIGSLQLFVPGCVEAADVLPGKFDTDQVHALAIFDIRTLNGDRHGGNVLVKYGKASPPGRGNDTDTATAMASNDNSCSSSTPIAAPIWALMMDAGKQQHRGSSSTTTSTPVNDSTTTTEVEEEEEESLVPHLVPIDHSYICPAGYAEPEFEWLYWPQSRLPFSRRSLEYIARLDARADAETVRTALMARSNPMQLGTAEAAAAATSGASASSSEERCRGQAAAKAVSCVDVVGPPKSGGGGSSNRTTRSINSTTGGSFDPSGDDEEDDDDDDDGGGGGGGCLDDDNGNAATAPHQRDDGRPRLLHAGDAAWLVADMDSCLYQDAIDDVLVIASPSAPTSRGQWGTTTVGDGADNDDNDDDCPLVSHEEGVACDGDLTAAAAEVHATTASRFLHVPGNEASPQSTNSNLHHHHRVVSNLSLTSKSQLQQQQQQQQAPEGPDAESAESAAEVMFCTTRLLQIASLEFHFTSRQIGELCRRPTLTCPSFLEEVMEDGRDGMTWRIRAAQYEAVVRRRFAGNDLVSREAREQESRRVMRW